MQRCDAQSAAQLHVPIEEASSVAEARRQAAAIGRSLGFDEAAGGALALGVTEAASNIVKHAGRGDMLLRAVGINGARGIEVLALDAGPGIANLSESLRDGHSTAGSPGTGLGTLSRMTRGLEIYSRPGKGTALRFVLWPRDAQAQRAALGVVCLPKPGETACGDGWAVTEQAERRVMFVVDGLGHGPDAAAAARSAIATALAQAARAPAEIIAAVDAALRATRGAAAGVAVTETGSDFCTFCGVGNISAVIYAEGSGRSMVSHNGTLGHQVRKIQEFRYPLAPGALCVMHTDGLGTRWALDAYPGLAQRHPALIAALLYRDFARGRDDVTVLAARHESPP